MSIALQYKQNILRDFQGLSELAALKSEILSDVADKYDSFENIESCRYLRKRTKDKYELNPFSIEEIFRDTRVKGRSSFK